MPARPSSSPILHCAVLCFVFGCGGFAFGQEAEEGEAEPDTAAYEQALVDMDALVVGTEVTTRCALYDWSVEYLTPLEQVGARLRLAEMIAAGTAAIPDLPDQLAQMHAEAAQISCGVPELAPYLDFSRQIARDVIDVALVAWRTIDIRQCNYFADDDFLEASERARAVAADAVLEGEDNRITYIENAGAAWAQTFAANCGNLRFDPVETLPGQIALALPTQ